MALFGGRGQVFRPAECPRLPFPCGSGALPVYQCSANHCPAQGPPRPTDIEKERFGCRKRSFSPKLCIQLVEVFAVHAAMPHSCLENPAAARQPTAICEKRTARLMPEGCVCQPSPGREKVNRQSGPFPGPFACSLALVEAFLAKTSIITS